MKGAIPPKLVGMFATAPDSPHGGPAKNAGDAAQILRTLAKLAAQLATLSGAPSVRAPLRGRYVGLIAGGPPDNAGPDQFAVIETAALALGARTAHLGITPPISAGDLVLLAGLYDLVCCGKTLNSLAPQMAQAGIHFMHGVLEPRDPVALMALLIADWRLVAPAESPLDSHLWRAEVDQQYGIALQCALMEALA